MNRRLLSLALIPPTHINRAFYIIANASPPPMAEFLFYFKRTYIGLTADEANQKAAAFLPNPQILPAQMPSPIFPCIIKLLLFWNENQILAQNSTIITGNGRWNPVMNSTAISISPPRPRRHSNDAIVRPPIYSVQFWNINERAVLALAKTNNAMEASHCHYAVFHIKIIF